VRFPQEGKAYAEYVAAPISDIALKPQRLSHQEAAAVPLAALTAWQAIFDTAHLQSGQTILIHGAAGGVGHLAVQLAKWKGAKVIATTSARNAEFVRDLGADTVIDYTTQPFEDAVHDVDVVFNTVSDDIVKRSFQGIKSGGFLVSIAGHPDPEIGRSHGVQSAQIMVHTPGIACESDQRHRQVPTHPAERKPSAWRLPSRRERCSSLLSHEYPCTCMDVDLRARASASRLTPFLKADQTIPI
jgi:NADPH:quinone reductase-like Zn-dependent oxidoreductase